MLDIFSFNEFYAFLIDTLIFNNTWPPIVHSPPAYYLITIKSAQSSGQGWIGILSQQFP